MYKLLVSIAGNSFSFAPGAVVTDKDLGEKGVCERLVASGQAEKVEPKRGRPKKVEE